MSKTTSDLQNLLKVLGANEKYLPSQSPTFHFFKREYSFTCYGWQAVTIAEEYYKTKRVIRHEQGMECVDISKKLLSKICGSLLDRSCNISLWHKPNPSPFSPWELRLEARPGNFGKLEEELGTLDNDQSSACYSMCAVISENCPTIVGVALVSSITRQINLHKVVDETDYSRLRSLMVRYNVETVHFAVRSTHPNTPSAEINGDLPTFSPNSFDNHVKKVLIGSGVEVNFIPLDFGKIGMESRRTKILSQLNVLKISEPLPSSTVTDSLQMKVDQSDLWLAIDAVGALMRELKIWDDSDYKCTFRIKCGEMEEILLYDKNVLDILNVFPRTDAPSRPISEDCNEESNSKCTTETSLFSILNQTKSKMGSRLLRLWLQHPLRDKRLIEERQAVIDLFIGNVEKLNLIRESREHLKTFADMERLVLRLRSVQVVSNAGNVLKDILELYKCTLKASSIGDVLNSISNSGTASSMSLGADLLQNCAVFKKFHGLIEELIDTDHMQMLSFDPKIRTNSGGNDFKPLSLHKDRYVRVKPSFSAELTTLYDALVIIEGQIKTCYISLLKALNHDEKDLHLEDSPVHGLHFRVTKRLSPKVLKALDVAKVGYEILSNQKAGTLFITREMKTLVQKFSMTCTRYQDVQVSIVQQALEVVQSYTIPALHVASLVATVDVLAALAHQALQNDWIRPQFSSSVDNSGDEKSLTIKGLRHVILEQKIGTLAVVANDVKVNQQDGYCMIITGPNMGGKSTFMLSIGLAVLMAQLGSFIPATSAVMPIYDQLFVRSGSSDLSAIGFSSFMAEMVDTADIIRHATGQSLILIDEIGRGTSTSDGFGLAWAILEELALSNKATVFCATHFHELNNLTNDGLHDVNPIKLEECHRLIFKSLHVDAHIDKKFQDVFMLYRVKEGSCSRSYGIHVAKVAKFPEEIISKALEIEENLNFTMDKRQNKRMISAIGDDHTPKKFARPELKPADLELIDQEPL